jgi:Flp pilus assembly protein TadD
LIVSLALISVRQCLVWRTEESLWTEAVRLAPGKVRPRIQLARSLPWERAVLALDEARRLAPDDPDVASEEGRVHLSAGRPELALAAFGRALALRPSDPKGLNNRGVALMALGQREAAKADFEAALQRNPCLMDARQNLKTLGIDVSEANRARFPCVNGKEGR